MVFRAVAKQLSFRKAAEELFLTQPAVSLQIKALEEDVGVQLFERAASHISLTGAGEVLLKYAERVHGLMSEAAQEIAALSGDQSGQLGLGASTTIAQYVLPGLLSIFLKQHPRVVLSLTSGNTEHVIVALQNHTIALGLIEGPARGRTVRTEPFLTDELILIVPSAHEWSERSSISRAELITAPLLLRERGSGTRQVIESALERSGMRSSVLHSAMELDSTESIKSAVEAGLGVGFVSRWALAKDTRFGQSIKTVAVQDLKIERPFLIVRLTGPELQGPPAEFQRFLLSRANLENGFRLASSSRAIVAHKKRK